MEQKNTSTSPIVAGMIGCGGFASRYHLPALLEMPGVELRWICDTAPSEALEITARKHGATLVPETARVYADNNCKAVIVSTPHTLHYGHVLEALRFGRHVLVDKPLATRVSEAIELAETACKAHVVNAVAFNRRFDPGCVRAREVIRSGGLGKLTSVTAVQLGYGTGWILDPDLGGGGVFWGRGIHLADLIPWITGAKATRVRGRLRNGPPNRVDFGGSIDVAFEEFDCHMVCKEEGWSGWDEIRIFGDRGMIELRRPHGKEHGWGMRFECQDHSVNEFIAPDEQSGAATRDFVNAVATHGIPRCTFGAAVQSVAIIESAFTSASKGETWLPIPC